MWGKDFLGQVTSRQVWLATVSAGVLLALSVGAQQDAPDPVPARCTGLCRPNRAGHFIARDDFVRPDGLDGNALLVLVNRTPTGALAPDYAPRDLLDLEGMQPRRPHQCTPPATQCLRREAALAYGRMAEAMRAAGHRPYVSSAFRAYPVQCSTFLSWASRRRTGFCGATTTSALPGHSQHQLGTTLDLFTRDWMDAGYKFRAGYGCSPGGRWLSEHAREYGFVLPYPLHPDYRNPERTCAAVGRDEARTDPRTGYRHEPWHFRYIGVEACARYESALVASRTEPSGELTLEQWLQREAGVQDPVAAPVCDGCNCDRCATFATSRERPCETPALILAANGEPRPMARPPVLLNARLERVGEHVILEARVDIAANTLTQPPVLSGESVFRRGRREAQLADRSARAFGGLPSTWRLGIGFDDRTDFPWRAALVEASREGEANGMNARFPAPPGVVTMRLRLAGVSRGTDLRVALVSADAAHSVRRLRAP